MEITSKLDVEFIEEVDSCLESLERFERTSVLDGNMDELCRLTHTVKGAASLCGHPQIELLTSALEQTLLHYRGAQALPPIFIETLLTSITALRFMLGELQERGDTGPAPAELLQHLEQLAQAPDEERPSLGDLLVRGGWVEEVDLEEAGAAQLRGDPRRIGELLVAWGRLSPKVLEQVLEEQRAWEQSCAGAVSRCLVSLQDGMAPAQGLAQEYEAHPRRREEAEPMNKIRLDRLWSRLAAMAQKLTASEDKRVRVSTEGGELLISQSAMRILMVTLSQLTRNAIAHGLETPKARRAAGKPEEGALRYTAQAHEDTLRIEVWDDGRGIDLPSVIARARALGHTVDEGAPPEALWALIFSQGLTTCQSPGPDAGVGVGMNAVMGALHRASGKIEVIRSGPEGTGFLIELKL